MLYIIKDLYVFSAETKELRLKNTHEVTLTLSNQASRLLMEFIKNGDAVLSKDYLLKAVWQDFGLTPSSHNVYSAMSELRRSFSKIGEVEPVIKTIPKVGFKFTQKVRQFSEETKDNRELKTEERENKIILIPVMLLFSMLTLLVSYVAAESQRKTINFSEQKTKKIGMIENCSIYSFGYVYPSKDEIALITEGMLRENGKCSNGTYDVFYAESHNKGNYTFMSSCEKSKTGTHKNCVIDREIKW